MAADGVNYTRVMARYRLRTSMRGVLPGWAGRFAHAGNGVDRCYHCEVAMRPHDDALGPSVAEVLRRRLWRAQA